MRTRKNIKSLENTIRGMVSEAKADDVRQEIESAYNQIKVVKNKLKGLGNTNKKNKPMKMALRSMVDELEELEDLDIEEEMSEEEEEVARKNEQSEGYGTWQGLGMKENVIKLRESDMNYIFKQVLNESVTCTVTRDGGDCCDADGGNCDTYENMHSGVCGALGGSSSGYPTCSVVGPGDIMGGFLELPDFEEDWGGQVMPCLPGEIMGTYGCECENPKLGCGEEVGWTPQGKQGCVPHTCYDGTFDMASCSCKTDMERMKDW